MFLSPHLATADGINVNATIPSTARDSDRKNFSSMKNELCVNDKMVPLAIATANQRHPTIHSRPRTIGWPIHTAATIQATTAQSLIKIGVPGMLMLKSDTPNTPLTKAIERHKFPN